MDLSGLASFLSLTPAKPVPSAFRVLVSEPRVTVYAGDCGRLAEVLAENSVDAIVTDPPSGIGFMASDWDKDKGGRDAWVAWLAETITPAYRALKPGGFALVWALPRTSHWAAYALEDAGFEIRDVHHHLFGSGMPKSLDLMREVDMHLCIEPGRHYDKNLPPAKKRRDGDHLCPEHPERERVSGIRRTGLKPAVEHWILARKPLEGSYVENALRFGTGGLNVEACRIGSRWPAHLSLDDYVAAVLDEQSGIVGSGGGEIQQHNVAMGFKGGAGSTRKVARSRDGGASRFFYAAKPARSEKEKGLDHLEARSGGEATGREDDSLGTQNPRAGAGRTGGAKNVHPTVKSEALMEWLIRLITPPGGTVLDMFAGSGSTGVAALKGGFQFIGCELGGDNGEYLPILEGRIRHALATGVKAPTPMPG